MKHIFVINPISGKSDASVYLVPKIEAAARKANVEFEIICTAHAGHACELAQAYGVAGQSVRLYACGGDGTLNELFRGAYAYPNVEIASIPCGSGNDFVRNFGDSEAFLNLSDNIAGTAIPIDLMQVGEGVSAAICSTGMDADVAYGIPKFRRIPFCGGTMAYNLSILQCLLKPIGHRLRVKIDDTVYEDTFLIAAVCNGMAYGGGYKAAPTADLQDGSIEVVLVKKISRFRIASVLALYKAGKHIENGAVVDKLADVLTYHHAHSVEITPLSTQEVIINIDGECGPARGLSAEILPCAAKFVLPSSLYAAFAGMKDVVCS